jgi:hypothetical protein
MMSTTLHSPRGYLLTDLVMVILLRVHSHLREEPLEDEHQERKADYLLNILPRLHYTG